MPVRLTQTATVLAKLPNFYLPTSRQNANCSNTHRNTSSINLSSHGHPRDNSKVPLAALCVPGGLKRQASATPVWDGCP